VTVLEVRDGGLEVQAGDDGATGFIKRSDLGRDRDEQRPDRFQVGQKLDAMVTGFDRSKKPNFSVKARQLHEEKEAVEQYGSSDAGASLGDILGAALKAKKLGLLGGHDAPREAGLWLWCVGVYLVGAANYTRTSPSEPVRTGETPNA
jgi:predicted RNA-binding protein with RPS1 domain